jgi:hypothetical protein
LWVLFENSSQYLSLVLAILGHLKYLKSINSIHSAINFPPEFLSRPLLIHRQHYNLIEIYFKNDSTSPKKKQQAIVTIKE